MGKAPLPRKFKLTIARNEHGEPVAYKMKPKDQFKLVFDARRYELKQLTKKVAGNKRKIERIFVKMGITTGPLIEEVYRRIEEILSETRIMKSKLNSLRNSFYKTYPGTRNKPIKYLEEIKKWQEAVKRIEEGLTKLQKTAKEARED